MGSLEFCGFLDTYEKLGYPNYVRLLGERGGEREERGGERGERGGRGDEEDPGNLSDRDFGPRVCPCGPGAAQNPYACVS